MKKAMKILTMIFMIVILTNVVFADGCTECWERQGRQRCGMCGYSCSMQNGVCMDNDVRDTTNSDDDWWGRAYSFFNGSYTESNISALSDIQNMIEIIGNMIFVATTVVLGVKYIWGSVESKASVKDSLVTLVIGALFFYGWSTIKDMFIGNDGVFQFGSTYETTAKSIYSTIIYVCNFLAVGGIVYVGVRYMMAGADGKAQLKAKSVPMILGIIMVYATITFLKFIVSII